LAVTLEFEGGFVNHPKDPGGATNRGVTQAVYDTWRVANGKTRQSVKFIASAEVEKIYSSRYWNAVQGDALPIGVDLTVFDYGVNSGPSRAVKDVQRVVGAKVDGKIGSETTSLARDKILPRALIKALCAKRLSFVQSLKIWSTFGRGWARRIAAVEAKALSWVSSKPQLEADAKEAQAAANKQAGGIVVTTSGGVGADQAPDAVINWPLWAIAIVVALIVVPLIIRFTINSTRAKALAAVAKEA
jgi:lysozyme family protein